MQRNREGRRLSRVGGVGNVGAKREGGTRGSNWSRGIGGVKYIGKVGGLCHSIP